MNKRLISILLSMAMIFSIFAMLSVQTTATSVYEDSSNFEYKTLEDNTIVITEYTGDSKVVNIPLTIDGKKVTSISDYAFEFCESLTKVTIPDSVTSIGDWTFVFCDLITSIDVNSKNANYSSENGVLFNKDKTTLIRYPAGKTDTNYTIPHSVTLVGKNAFYMCKSLVKITIPDSVTSISDYAFCDCESLTKVTIPDSVTSIGEEAFYDCESLTKITIPDSVTNIDESAFIFCDSLTSIDVNSKNANYSSEDGVLFNKDKTTLIRYPEGKVDENYTIQNSVTSVGKGAFKACDLLTKVTIPDSVTNIGEGAFEFCDSLTSVTIPDSVTSIGDYAFEFCNSLKSVTLGNSVEIIGSGAFSYCDSLISITIPDSVINISKDAFESSDNIIIKCNENSTAHNYAVKNGIDFKFIGSVTYGDCNDDDKVNMSDVLSLRKYIAKWDIYINSINADCNADNKINMADVLLLRKYLAKWNVTLGK